MKKRILALALSAMLLAPSFFASAQQQPGKIHRIGFLSGDFLVPRIGPRHCVHACVRSVTSRARI
jgi:hypothetical protein